MWFLAKNKEWSSCVAGLRNEFTMRALQSGLVRVAGRVWREKFLHTTPILARAVDMSKYDPTQVQFLDADMCIVVDEDDKEVRPASKRETHAISAEEPVALLHRAFSVFLFNSEGAMLLQQRAPEKILFPNRWTNTCCSHPLWNESELPTTDALGVRNAAVRKLEHELGISNMSVEDFHFNGRVHYAAPNCADWGEHEVDYLLFATKDVTVDPNPNEVSAHRYITPDELRAELEAHDADYFSPWFRKIAEAGLLFPAWEAWEQERRCIHAKPEIIRLGVDE